MRLAITIIEYFNILEVVGKKFNNYNENIYIKGVEEYIMFKKVEAHDLRPIREIILYELRNAIFEGHGEDGDRLVESQIAESRGDIKR